MLLTKEQVQKKLMKKEKEVLEMTKVFLNSQGIEFNEVHRSILINAMREMMGYCKELIEPHVTAIIADCRKMIGDTPVKNRKTPTKKKGFDSQSYLKKNCL